MIQSNILLTDVIIPKYDKFTQVKANNQSDTDIPVYDNAIPTNLSLNTNSPSNDDVLPTYETITLSPLIPGTGSIFPTDVNLLPKITNLNDLLAHLSEVQIRFNSNPDYYMQNDFALLIKTITESLINIYVNTPVTVDEFQSLEDLVDTKVDKINNKSLSTNDYSDEDKLKLDGIENGANVNIQSDWLATTGDSKILNKPEIPSLTGIATEEYVISYAQIKKGVGEYYINLDEKNNIHEPHSDDQDLSNLVVKIPGYSLVANSEIAKIHAAGSDDQDLSAYETTFNNNAKLINKVDKIFGYSLVSNADIANIHPPHLDDQDLSIYETILNNNSKLESKVDKIIGYGLSETNFTQAEKTKLALLESSHYKGRYLSLGALQIAYPLANAGDYARIDGGVGIDVTTYIWDDNDTKWILEGGSGTTETAGSIKAKYESNPDTNVFDNDAKTKLAGIAATAQVNILEGVQRNGVDLSITDKKVNVIVPTVPADINAEPANVNIQTHISSISNPHNVTKTQIGLSNVDNTSDLLKPISSAVQTALNGKQNSGTYSTDIHTNITDLNSVSGVNTGDETTLSIQTKRPLKTVTNKSLEGTGNIGIDYNDLDNKPPTFSPSSIISKFIFNEIPSGIIDGINSIFNTNFLLVPDTEVVFINGQKQKKPDDYNISGQTITFTFSPGIGESLTINYIKQ